LQIVIFDPDLSPETESASAIERLKSAQELIVTHPASKVNLWLELYSYRCYALHAAISVERDARAPFGPVAKSIPALANRNLLWRQDAGDWIPGVLGIHVARAQKSMAISKMDG
jgi:hypothetical protein